MSGSVWDQIVSYRRSIVLILAAGPLLWAVFSDFGIIWPDEIHQSLEPAHRLVFGYGIVPWEFREGARSWLLPGAIGALWKIAAALGVESSKTLIILARLPLAALVLSGVWGSMCIAEKAKGGDAGEIMAGVLVAFFPVLVIFDHRMFSETVTAPLVVLTALFLWDPDRRSAAIAGIVCTLAFLVRYQIGLVLLGALMFLLSTRRTRDARWFVVGSGGVLVLGGALDTATWGAPFLPLYRYLEFNFFLGGAAKFGTEPMHYYALAAWTAAGPAILFVAYGAWAALRFREPNARWWVGIAAAFVFVHSLIGHKELRFIIPVIPLTLAIAGAHLGRMLERLPRGRVWVAVVGVYLVSLMSYKTATLTFAEIAQWRDQPLGRRSPWHFVESFNEALRRAGENEDVCGVVAFAPRGWGWSGGFTYVHRDIPVFFTSAPRSDQIAAANYVIRPVQRGDRYGAYELVRKKADCAPPPADYDRRPPR